MKIYIKPFILLLALFTTVGCSKDDIDYFDSSYDSVRFPGDIPSDQNGSKDNTYDTSTGVLFRNFSFIEMPLEKEYNYDMPVVLIGNKANYDREIAYEVDSENTVATEGSYEIIKAVVPADSIFGYIRVKVIAPSNDETNTLYLKIKKSKDLAAGPSVYTRAALSWNNSIPAPSATNNIRSYNMLVKGTSAFSSASLSHYSPQALKTIVAALGWNNWDNKEAHSDLPYSTSYFKYKYLPDYRIIYSAGTYQGYASLLGKYIEEYNKTHDEPLVHDAGALIGQPIEARQY